MRHLNTDRLLSEVYTKDELRFIKYHGWRTIPASANQYGIRQGEFYPWSYVWEVKQRENLLNEIKRRAKVVRAKMDSFFAEKWRSAHTLDEWIAEQDKQARIDRQRKRDRNSIDAMIKSDGCAWGYEGILHNLRLGENIGRLDTAYSNENGVAVKEDEERYSRGCKFWKVTRNFTLLIKKGYHVFYIGGLITFVKGGRIVRDGMACEWVEQGRTISDTTTIKGYLVRGEHIVAKSLKEAKDINAKKRAVQVARLLSARRKAERRAERIANGTVRITFTDSLESGNCRAGTSEFKRKYEDAVGHKVKDITIAELRKYAKQFGVEYYAERVIRYVLNIK